MLDIIGLIGLGYPIADDACPIYVSVHTHEYRPYAKVSREASNTLLYLIYRVSFSLCLLSMSLTDCLSVHIIVSVAVQAAITSMLQHLYIYRPIGLCDSAPLLC